MSMKGKTVIVTGGSNGIGLKTAQAFARTGANLALVDIKTDGVTAAADIEREFGATAKLYACDVSDFAAVGETVKRIAADFGAVDVLVNNAGITKDKLLVRMSEAEFDAVLGVNLKGTFNFCRHVAPLMFHQRHGRIISISSVVGLFGNAGQVNYSASKAGIVGLTKSLAKELGPRGVTVNAVAPGFIETSMTGVLSDEVRAAMFSRISLGRIGSPENVADAVLFLASGAASYITGQVLQVDGGLAI